MKQLTEAKLAEMLKEAYIKGFNDGVYEVFEDADPEEFLDLAGLDQQLTKWVDSV